MRMPLPSSNFQIPATGFFGAGGGAGAGSGFAGSGSGSGFAAGSGSFTTGFGAGVGGATVGGFSATLATGRGSPFASASLSAHSAPKSWSARLARSKFALTWAELTHPSTPFGVRTKYHRLFSVRRNDRSVTGVLTATETSALGGFPACQASRLDSL